jgi:predicted TIM-barrel fold metal-dependent hydrolase
MDTALLTLVSADSHVAEPRFLWYDNLPPSMRDRAPRTIVPAEEGSWELEQHESGRVSARRRPDETEEQQLLRERAEERQRLAALEPDARLRAMREDGISAECVFPSIGLYVWMIDDEQVGRACCEIYNDWVFDQLESKSPRWRCAGLIPTWSVDHAVREVERISRMGLGAAMLPLVGTPEYNDPVWDPLWAAIEESGLPAVMHQGTGHSMLFYRGPGAAVSNLLATQSMAPRSAGLLTMSGALERHPGLHVVFVEVNASWIGWTMDTLDFYTDAFTNYQDEVGRNWVRPHLAEKPSHYMARQLHATFQDDPSAVANLARTGVAPLLWGSDYPHEESTYPHSRDTVAKLFGHLDPADAAMIAGGTCAELFGFDHAVLTTPL